MTDSSRRQGKYQKHIWHIFKLRHIDSSGRLGIFFSRFLSFLRAGALLVDLIYVPRANPVETVLVYEDSGRMSRSIISLCYWRLWYTPVLLEALIYTCVTGGSNIHLCYWRLWYTNEAVIAGLGAVICLPGQHFSLVSCSAGGELQLLLVMSRSLMGSRRGSYRCGDLTTPRWHNVTPPYTAQWASTGGHLVMFIIWEEWRLSWESLKKIFVS